MHGILHAGVFGRNIEQIHPSVRNDNKDPPAHIIVTEAVIHSSNHHTSKRRPTCVHHQRCLAWGQNLGIKCGSTHFDSTHCLHVGTLLIYNIDNTYLEDTVPCGNGTLYQVVFMKLMPATQTRWKNYYGKNDHSFCQGCRVA